MKYKVVKDNNNDNPCIMCAFESALNCWNYERENNLPNCYINQCHFELADEITTTDLRQKDNADDEK